MLALNALGVELQKLLRTKLLFLDGAMGTMIQQEHLEEEQFRGAAFQNHPLPLKGNNDLLVLTQPEIIRKIHRQYLEAGSDIIETNTFNANRVSQADYGLEAKVREINVAAARLAREACDAELKRSGRRCYVAGSIGPTNKTASLSPDVQNPAYRAVSFDDLRENYEEQIRALLEGGVDLLMPETVFDTLNLKACLFAIQDVEKERGEKLPVILSVTITDQSGRTLTGQTVEAFWNSVRHSDPLFVGMNCALGAEQMRPWLLELSRCAEVAVSCYPNAGLPNPLSPTGYDEKPASIAATLKTFAEDGLLNLVGGCCGTTPDHIAAIVDALKDLPPREIPSFPGKMRLSGLEPFNLSPHGDSPFCMIGERTNVTGSPKFATLIKENRFAEAVEVARQQVANGSNVIDINFDEGLLDGVACMRQFLNLLAAEPDVARVPFMIDSSRFEVLEEGLKCVQGKALVNSLSLKEGEADFLKKAELIKRYGAAVVIMAFDEEGQAVSQADKVRICRRAYDLLTKKLNFDPCDIVFDPNVLAIGTGLEEHNNYGVDFLKALKEIKKACPGSFTSGGLSNLSFSFRGQNKIREAIHSVFLSEAIPAGLDMAIVNAGMLQVVNELDPTLRKLSEDLIFNRDPQTAEKLIEFSAKLKTQPSEATRKEQEAWRQGPYRARISHALVNGIDLHIQDDTAEAYADLKEALQVIEGPLMDGMKVVGELFGQGKMFLPQVVKSARVMKKAVAWLEPHLLGRSQASSSAGTIIMATVKGDVHDIGKNIVGVVMACNGYKVIDLGVMVPCERIIDEAIKHKADLIGLSGLITPSLDEMIFNVKEFTKRGLKTPILIGGATTSAVHTAVKIVPMSGLPVVHVNDASLVIEACRQVIGPGSEETRKTLLKNQEAIKAAFHARGGGENIQLKPLSQAREHGFLTDWTKLTELHPEREGVFEIDSPLSEVIPYIDWSPFFWTWGFKGTYPQIFDHPERGVESRKLFDEAQLLLKQMQAESWLNLRARVGLWPAMAEHEDIHLLKNSEKFETFRFLRQQREKEAIGGRHLCLSDFVAPRGSGKKDWFGCFAVTAGSAIEERSAAAEKRGDDYESLMIKAIGDRLAEALAERAHQKMREMMGFGKTENLTVDEMIKEKYRGIRPAPGYPACPDHFHKTQIWKLLDVEKSMGARLSESLAIIPASSVSGFYFFHPEAKYFHVGPVGPDQMERLAQQHGISLAETRRLVSSQVLLD